MKETTQSRAQRRAHERNESQARSTYQSLCDRFMDFFINQDDPDSDYVEIKRRQIDAQWKMYCKAKNLLPVALPMFDDFSKQYLKEYFEIRNDKKEMVDNETAIK